MAGAEVVYLSAWRRSSASLRSAKADVQVSHRRDVREAKGRQDRSLAEKAGLSPDAEYRRLVRIVNDVASLWNDHAFVARMARDRQRAYELFDREMKRSRDRVET